MESYELAEDLREFAKSFKGEIRRFIKTCVRNEELQRRVLYAVGLIGLRERAFLAEASSDVSGADWSRAKMAALAAELFIASALTGDDVLDGARVRWRQQSVWARWGAGQAWLVTETLHCLAQRAIEALPSSVRRSFQAAFLNFFDGQFGEIVPGSRHSVPNTIRLARRRTAHLFEAVIAAPAQIAESPLLPALKRYGRNIGLSLQLADDLFDFTGDASTMGKPVLGDLRNNQPNIVLAHFRSTATEEQIRSLEAATLAAGRESERAQQEVLGLLSATGSIEYTKDIVHRYLSRAAAALQQIPPGTSRTRLQAMTRFLAEMEA